MTLDQKISLGSAIVALLSLFGTIFFAWKASISSRSARSSEERTNDIAVGQSETALREAISGARQRIEEASFKIEELLLGRKPNQLNAAENRRLELLSKSRSAIIENYLNAYEDACGKYIDNKIDKIRFKKSYVSEIANLCKADVESYAKHMHPKATSKYEAIWKVYDEWHRHEK